jgi:hypothetical protein
MNPHAYFYLDAYTMSRGTCIINQFGSIFTNPIWENLSIKENNNIPPIRRKLAPKIYTMRNLKVLAC